MEKATEGQRARFEIKVTDNQVLLTVYPGGDKRQAILQAIKEQLAHERLPAVSERVIEQAINQATGEPVVLIAELSAFAKDAEVKITVSQDKLQAKAVLRPAEWGKHLTLDELEMMVAATGLQYGIDNKVLRDLVSNQDTPGEWVIASGTPPVAGEPTRFVYQIDLEKSLLQPSFLPDGRVDFRQLDNIENVEAGQVLLKRVASTPGTPGKDVYGNEIAAQPGRDLPWPIGKNVLPSGDTLIAEIQGQAVLRQNRLSVLPVFEVPGDVDFSVGNIKFVGNVLVRGSVRSGFSIEADGDVKIMGWVDSANINCTGSLVVSGGIQGQGRGEVQVGGDVYCRFIENCKLAARGMVMVGEDIMHSQVEAGRQIKVGGKKGLIVGGVVRAKDSIECKVIGASFGTPTHVEVGLDPAVYERYGQLQAGTEKLDEDRRRLQQGLQGLNLLKEKLGELPPEREELRQRLVLATHQIEKDIVLRRSQLANLEEEIQSIRDACVSVSQVAHPGARITIGRATLFVREEFSAGRFVLQGPDVRWAANG